MKRTLSLLMVLCMLLCMLPTTLFSVSASEKETEPRVLTDEDYAPTKSLWEDIREKEDDLNAKKATPTQRIEAIIAMVEASDNYVEGSLERNPDNFTWKTDEGIACIYIYDEEKEDRGGSGADPIAVVGSGIETISYAKKGHPSGINVGLVGPWYGIDGDFDSTYGVGSYESFAKKIAQATGGTVTIYKKYAANIDAVADVIQNSAFALIDSHGTYNYTSGRWRSYLRLSTNSGITDKDYENGDCYYNGSYYQGDAFMVTGGAISNHMEEDAPNSFVWMGICSGMRYDTMQAPLRERGVEACMGFSRTISFEWDRYWLSKFVASIIDGNDVATAAAYMKSKHGKWDRNTETAYNTYQKAVDQGKAFPIFVSNEDPYPSDETQTEYPYDVQIIQNVYSTWRLYCPHTYGSSFSAGYAATCTAAGQKDCYTCNHCGAKFTDAAMTQLATNATIAALGHSYSNGVCTRCDHVSGITLRHFWAGSEEAKFSWTHENASASGMDTSDNGVIYSTSNGNDHYFHMTSGTGSIAHTVKSGDVIEVRYRTTNVPASLRNTTQSFEFWYTTTSSDSSFSSSMVLKANATIQEGTWQTVQFTPSTGITLKRIMFDFLQESKGFSGTKLEIDYVFIGPSARRPSQNAKNTILFDYTKKFTDELRYAGAVYNDRNYDNGNWGGNGIGNVSYNGTDMVVPVTSGATSFSVKTTDGKLNASATPLSYTPASKDMIQVRVKLNNLQAVAGKDAKLVATYIKNNGTTATAELTKLNASNFNGEYFTVTAYLDNGFTAASVINAIGIGFENVTNVSGKSGSVSVDYIAVGQLASLPVPTVPCTVTFKDEAGNVLETVSATVGGSVSYSGATPTKAYDSANHYTFAGWKTADGTVADLTKVSGDLTVYASFNAVAHSYEEEVLATPNCTATGLIRYNCSGCDYSYVSDPIPALGHTVVADKGYAATCTAPGMSDGSRCSVCNTVIVAQTVIPAKGHTEVIVPGYAAGCLNSGLTDGISCSVCQIVIQAQQPIARLGHEYKYTDNGDGTHDGACIRCDKTQTGKAHTVVDGVCTLCGNGGATTPELDSAIVIRHTLNLASDISMNYAVEAKLLSGYDSFYLSCAIPTYSGNTYTGETTVELQPELKGNYYYFTLDGLNAVQINNKINATLHMTKGVNAYISNVDSYSVADYAYTQLNKDGAAQSLKALCAELLRYGAKAQIYKGYRTDALADASLTAEQSALLSELDSITFGNTNQNLNDLASAPITWEGKALNLNSKVTLKYIFNASNFSGNVADLTLRVSYSDIYGNTVNKTVSDPQVYNASKNWYAFDLDTLLASELRSVVSVAVYNGNTRVSSTLIYSADTYGNGRSGDLLILCKALFSYSDTAKAYFVNN